MTTLPLARDNVAYLQQGLDLLEDLDDAQYTKEVEPMFSSTIGAHYRHSLDHYTRFLEGWKSGKIDYDARARDTRIETDRAFAMEQTRAVMNQLNELRPDDGERAVVARMACDDTLEHASPDATSTVKRELQFLISHTVHHYALIAVALRLDGREPVAGFGVAPSTLRHQQTQAPCAP